MSHLFKVGDRVALAHPLDGVLGQQGTITEIGLYWPAGTPTLSGRPLRIDCNCTVSWDKFYGLQDNPQHTDQLEPLSPPKSQIDEILAMKDLPEFEIGRVAA